MGRDALNDFFCEDDWDPLTRAPDEWTEEDQKKLDKRSKLVYNTPVKKRKVL